jgi:predicted small secreted protein
MKTFSRVLLLLALTALLPACNTIRGVGEDLSAVGNTLARVAD